MVFFLANGYKVKIPKVKFDYDGVSRPTSKITSRQNTMLSQSEGSDGAAGHAQRNRRLSGVDGRKAAGKDTLIKIEEEK